MQEVLDGKVRVDAGPLGHLTASAGKSAFSVGQSNLVAIRPEKITISSEKPTDGNAMEGVMDATAYLGDRSHFYVRINGVEKPIAVSAQNLDETPIFDEYHQGLVWLSWSDDAIVLLNVD